MLDAHLGGDALPCASTDLDLSLAHHDEPRARLIHGDCIDVLRTMPAASVASVVTDPPYGIDFQSGHRTTGKFRKILGDQQPFVWFLPEAYRVLRDGGSILCFCRWDTAEAFRLAMEWAGFTIRSQVVWDRLHHGMGDLKASFGPQHDTIWFGTKGKFAFPDKRPVSVVRSQRLSGEALTHPTEKPVDLLRQLVRSVTPVGGVVLDPFAGSGSTLEAAIAEGCRAVGVEIDDHYVAVARNRLGI